MPKWDKKILDLKEGHVWKSRPGYRIFVAGRGAVRIDVPDDWVLRPDKDSSRFHDADPPDDDCVMIVSYNRLWETLDGAPIARFLKGLVDGDTRGRHSFEGKIKTINRLGMRLVWSEHGFIDPAENREAISRMLIGVAGYVQCLVTMDYWPEDAVRVTPVWDEMLRSLRLGVHIPDPTTGATIIPWLN